jgi:hypothetical protein
MRSSQEVRASGCQCQVATMLGSIPAQWNLGAADEAVLITYIKRKKSINPPITNICSQALDLCAPVKFCILLLFYVLCLERHTQMY